MLIIILLFVIMLSNISMNHCYHCIRSIRYGLRDSLQRRYVSDLNDSLDDFIRYAKIKDNDGAIRSMRYLDIGDDRNKPAIIILGGTAQTISTFNPHVRPISKTRRLIIPELR